MEGQVTVTNESRVTLLYTAALGGRLNMLPRLFTRIRQERGENKAMLLVDLGRSCRMDEWLCRVTDGRGMLVAMDGMGYDAFHIGAFDPLYAQPAVVESLKGVIVTPLAAGPWIATARRGDLSFTLANANNPNAARSVETVNPSTQPVDLAIGLRLSANAFLSAEWRGSGRYVLLDGGWDSTDPLFGRIELTLLPEDPYIVIESHRREALSDELANVPPDPTIMGVVEFVQSEARYAESKRGQ
jgi:hypothetical protein